MSPPSRHNSHKLVRMRHQSAAASSKHRKATRLALKERIHTAGYWWGTAPTLLSVPSRQTTGGSCPRLQAHINTYQLHMHQNNMWQITQAAETTAHFFGGVFNATCIYALACALGHISKLGFPAAAEQPATSSHATAHPPPCLKQNPMFQLMHAQPPSDPWPRAHSTQRPHYTKARHDCTRDWYATPAQQLPQCHGAGTATACQISSDRLAGWPSGPLRDVEHTADKLAQPWHLQFMMPTRCR